MKEMFYEDVCIYMIEEYSSKICKLFFDSSISSDLVHLVNEYHQTGHSVQFTCGQIADLLKSKYRK